MSKQKLNGIVAGQISYLKASLDDSDLLTASSAGIFWSLLSSPVAI